MRLVPTVTGKAPAIRVAAAVALATILAIPAGAPVVQAGAPKIGRAHV